MSVISKRSAILAALVVYFAIYGCTAYQPRVFNLDFMAFYCGGRAANSGGDPYRTEPLRTCEHTVGAVFRKGSRLAIPDPLPPYEIGAFRAIAEIPYAIASPLWCAFVLLICALTIGLVARIAAVPNALAAACLVLPLMLVSTYLGQVAPFSILGLLLLARPKSRNTISGSFLGTTLSLCEPHLALFAIVVGVLFSGRRTRIGTLASIGLCTAVSFAALPIPVLLEYFRVVLHAHLLSEINNREQYGTAFFFHALGASETAAVRAADASFAIAVLVAIVRYRVAVRRLGPEIALLGGSCFVLLFSPFLHLTQIVLAVPAALALTQRSHSRFVAAACVFLTVPWLQFSLVVAVAPLAIAAFVKAACDLLSVRRSIAIVAGTAAVLACAAAGFEVVGTQPGPIHLGYVDPQSLAETTWRAAVDWNDTGDSWLFLLTKLPSEAALAVVAIASLFALPRRSVADA